MIRQLLFLLGWPRCQSCRGLADLFEGRCIPCFRGALFTASDA